MGIATAGGDALRDALAAASPQAAERARARRVAPGVVVMVDAHGANGQPLRDPILRGWRATDP